MFFGVCLGFGVFSMFFVVCLFVCVFPRFVWFVCFACCVYGLVSVGDWAAKTLWSRRSLEEATHVNNWLPEGPHL
jgi:hypothetical protein